MGLKSDGTLYKWGCFPEQDQIIESGTHFTAMACHLHHALAIREDGSILAWGNNEFGQLNVPAPNSGFIEVACTLDGSVGLKADGTIVVWGQIGPVAAPNNHFTSIATNNSDAYAIRATVLADITGDGVVNTSDLLAVINSWGPCPNSPAECPADLTNDGFVNVGDLLMVINNWG